MKKSITIFLILAFCTAVNGQRTTIPEITKANYLKKSKHQKRAAWILLGIGSLATFSGIIEVNPNYGESTNRAFLFIGGLVMIGASVPMFTESVRNKKRGMILSFKNNTVPQLRNNNLGYSSVPSISLKIGL
jgi:hypothetical protein